MTTLAHARAALAVARTANTRAQWQAAALALAAALEARPLPVMMPAPATVIQLPVKRRKARPLEGGDVPHKGKTPIRHSARCALADGFSVRLSIGQFRGETMADCIAKMERLTLAIWRNNRATSAMGGFAATVNHSAEFGRRMASLEAPAVIECRIVKYGAGPRAGIDLECPVKLAA